LWASSFEGNRQTAYLNRLLPGATQWEEIREIDGFPGLSYLSIPTILQADDAGQVYFDFGAEVQRLNTDGSFTGITTSTTSVTLLFRLNPDGSSITATRVLNVADGPITFRFRAASGTSVRVISPARDLGTPYYYSSPNDGPLTAVRVQPGSFSEIGGAYPDGEGGWFVLNDGFGDRVRRISQTYGPTSVVPCESPTTATTTTTSTTSTTTTTTLPVGPIGFTGLISRLTTIGTSGDRLYNVKLIATGLTQGRAVTFQIVSVGHKPVIAAPDTVAGFHTITPSGTTASWDFNLTNPRGRFEARLFTDANGDRIPDDPATVKGLVIE
jgi:hypothetical protein